MAGDDGSGGMLGYALGWPAHHRERKEALADEERQLRVTDLYSKGKELSLHLSKLSDDDPLKAKGMDALANIEGSIAEIYHPDHNPGALQKDWHWLSALVTGKGKRAKPTPIIATRTEPGTGAATLELPGQDEAVSVGGKQIKIPAPISLSVPLMETPAYRTAQITPQAMTPVQRQAMAEREAARQRAQTDVLAAGLSPEQEAAADVRGRTAQLEGTMKTLDAFMGPNWNQQERERARQSLLQAALGTSGKEKYYPQIITTKDASGVEHYYRVPQQEDAPPEEIEFGPGQKMVPKTAPKAALSLKYDKTTGQVLDPATGQRYNAGDPNNPPEVNAMFAGADKVLNATRDFQTKLVNLRGPSYNAARPMPSYDTWNGNAPTVVPFSEYTRQPGRYLPAGPADKAIAKENLMEDIAGTSQLTREAINNLKEDFPPDMKAKIALAMRADDPHAAIDQLLASGALGSLTADQQDFLIATRQLSENAMAMRSVLGAGQGSEDVRRAITATLPGLLSPDRSYALRQLDAFDRTIARLHRGVPRVPLNEEPFTGGGAQPLGGGARGSRSIAAGMKYWRDKGQPKTEPWVIDDIQKHGYTPTRP
jgi:hypothetical protein